MILRRYESGEDEARLESLLGDETIMGASCRDRKNK
jgi:hypothetical protein